jgi:hypothetical protein
MENNRKSLSIKGGDSTTTAASTPQMGTAHGGKTQDKVTYPICIQHYKPLDLIAFALVNRQLQIYTIRQTVAKLLFEPRAKIRTEQMAVCMSVETHKVTDRLLLCLGFQYDLIQVHEFD